jgi:hypothetical protein
MLTLGESENESRAEDPIERDIIFDDVTKCGISRFVVASLDSQLSLLLGKMGLKAECQRSFNLEIVTMREMA